MQSLTGHWRTLAFVFWFRLLCDSLYCSAVVGWLWFYKTIIIIPLDCVCSMTILYYVCLMIRSQILYCGHRRRHVHISSGLGTWPRPWSGNFSPSSTISKRYLRLHLTMRFQPLRFRGFFLIVEVSVVIRMESNVDHYRKC